MLSGFESELKHLFSQTGYKYRDYTRSFTKLDFTVELKNKAWLKLDAKEKRQPLNRNNWEIPDWIPDGEEFILDDMGARKMLVVAPYSAIAVVDRPRGRYFVADVLTVWLMPRVRVNRPVGKLKMRGKWILSFQNFTEVGFSEILDYFEQLFDRETMESRYMKISETIGSYIGETVGTGGQVRTKTMQKYDYEVTR